MFRDRAVQTYWLIAINSVVVYPVFKLENTIRQVLQSGPGQSLSVIDHLLHVKTGRLFTEPFNQLHELFFRDRARR